MNDEQSSRWAIGSIGLLGAIAVWLLVTVMLIDDIEPMSEVLKFCLLGSFTTAIALACFFPHSQPVTLRVIGTLLFMTLLGFVVQDVQRANAGQGEIHWRGLVLAIAVGLAALYVAIFGKYPIWGWHASVFRSRQAEETSENS